MKKEELNCSNCGSNIIKIKDNVATCQHCGTKFLLGNTEINFNTNHKKVYNSNCYKIDDELNSNLFLKKAFMFLATKKEIPKDIFDAKFEAPKFSYTYISTIDCNIEISYSLTLLVETRQKRNVAETYYDNRSKKYKTHWVDRYVTETAEKPYSGNFKVFDKSICVQNANLNSYIKNEIKKQVLKFSNYDFKESSEDYPVPSNKELDSLLTENIQNSAKNYKQYIKINNYKDLDIHNGSGSISNVETYKVPIYSLDFKYKGKNYTIYCIANNIENLILDVIIDEKIQKITNYFNNRHLFIYVPFTIFSVILNILFITLTIAGLSISTLVKLFIAITVIMILGYVIDYIDKTICKYLIKQYTTESINYKCQIAQSLCNALNKKEEE